MSLFNIKAPIKIMLLDEFNGQILLVSIILLMFWTNTHTISEAIQKIISTV